MEGLQPTTAGRRVVNMKKVKILIADAYPVMRKGLKHVFSEHREFSIVGEADDGVKTLECVSQLKPDIVVLNNTMPGLDGIEVTRHLKEKSPEVKVIIYSMRHDKVYAANALKAGALGYVLRGSDADDLLSAVKSALAGTLYVSPAIAGEMLNAYVVRGETDAFDTLSPRDVEVFKLIAGGAKYEAIAARLSVSVSTVKKHRQNIMRKLDVDSTAGLVKIAIRKGFI